MATYVCVRDFTTGFGKRYHLGTEITDTQYAILSFNDKFNFRKKEEPATYSREAESFIPSSFDHMLGSSSDDFDSGDGMSKVIQPMDAARRDEAIAFVEWLKSPKCKILNGDTEDLYQLFKNNQHGK